MYVALVQIHVKPDCVDAFIEATLDNCRNSIHELGVAAFDLLHSQDDPTRFILYEMYRTPENQLAHRETAHYKRWRDAVEPLQAEPRSASKHDVVIQAKE
jgi:quinol monooxygenase YgiN